MPLYRPKRGEVSTIRMIRFEFRGSCSRFKPLKSVLLKKPNKAQNAPKINENPKINPREPNFIFCLRLCHHDSGHSVFHSSTEKCNIFGPEFFCATYLSRTIFNIHSKLFLG